MSNSALRPNENPAALHPSPVQASVKRIKYFNIVVLALLLGGCTETPASNHPDYESAKVLIEAGWLPAWLPKTATEIREAHNIDTNAVSAMFKPNTKDLWIPVDCKQIGPYQAKQPSVKPKWWPGDVPANRLSTYRHVFYECANRSYLAVLSSGSEAYYWTKPR
jgi:hypothetical protein